MFVFFFLIIYFSLCWVFTAASGLSPGMVSGGTLVASHRLLITVASLVAEHGL